MVHGLNENVAISGRIYHVQTEVTEGPQPVIRTTVYLDGVIVGSRELRVDPGSIPEDGIREAMASQHDLIIDNLIQRTHELGARAPGRRETQIGRGVKRRQDGPTPRAVKRPDLDDNPALITSVKVRQLIGPFGLALRPSPYQDPASVRARLESAAGMIDEIMTSPGFSEIRLDEQVCFFDLRERVAAWRGSGRNPERAAEILLAMLVFAGHLRRISDRTELVAFDHKLLSWALWTLGREGPSEEVMHHLRTLYGRDAELDRLLDQVEPVDTDHLLEVLLGLLDRTLPETSSQES